jgi:hypothetical protein
MPFLIIPPLNESSTHDALDTTPPSDTHSNPATQLAVNALQRAHISSISHGTAEHDKAYI